MLRRKMKKKNSEMISTKSIVIPLVKMFQSINISMYTSRFHPRGSKLTQIPVKTPETLNCTMDTLREEEKKKKKKT